MARMNRRRFIQSSLAAAGGAFAISGTKSSGQVRGANERIRVAVAGINGRGTSHMGAFAGMKDVEVAYLVDPDSRLFESRAKQIEQKAGNTPQCVQDIRKVLEDKNVDAISIATCNHWHSLMTIWACQAGKDVYVEKPLSHNVHEGRIAVQTARKHGRIVQHGTQSRASGGKHNEIAAVQSGKYGKLLVSKGYCCKGRWSIGTKPVETPPKELDFNLWLGPAPEQPYHANLVHYNWHWFWDFGNGDTGNQGVHEMDVARWAIKGGTLPKRIWSYGGRFAYEDQGQTPNTQVTVFDYDGVLLLFETRGLVSKHGVPANVSNEYYTTEGMIRDGKFHPKAGGEAVSLDKFETGHKPGDIFGNFILAMRSRKIEDLHADVETAHYSAALCHLANIAYRTGESTTWDAKKSPYATQPQVAAAMDAVAENLEKVGVPLQGLKYQVGQVLDFDPSAEKFTNSDAANRLLSRAPRKGFAVPEQV